jgi:hypothetical protein
VARDIDCDNTKIDVCEDITCEPHTGNCTITDIPNGTQCHTTQNKSGTCVSGKCTPS